MGQPVQYNQLWENYFIFLISNFRVHLTFALFLSYKRPKRFQNWQTCAKNRTLAFKLKTALCFSERLMWYHVAEKCDFFTKMCTSADKSVTL